MPSSKGKTRSVIRARDGVRSHAQIVDMVQTERYFLSLTPRYRKVALALMKALLRVQQKTG
jgi:hypothetical protein